MTLAVRPDAMKAIAETMAAGLRRPEPLAPSRWAAQNLIVPDGPSAGSAWNPSLTPYILGPLDFLGPDSPVNEVVVMKSAQSGFSTVLIAAIGHAIDRCPSNMMLVQPTDSALSDFNRDKLQPAIEASRALRAKVQPQTSRSNEGSTTYSKKYGACSLKMAIASSAADLRSATVKKIFRDEIDQYPDDLDDQGDPLDISDGRLMSFLASGDWKKVDISTPTVKGASKIQRRYEAGDKRRWIVPCPHCDHGEFTFEFGPNFIYNREFPFEAHYVAPCCGSIIAAHEKNGLVREGRWLPTDPRPGAFPSYHFDALSSPFVPWDEIAAKAVAAADDPQRNKAFHNLFLGLPFEIKGDAPDHVRLLGRRESGLTRGRIPPAGLMLVAAADVQMRGIWCEVLAVAPTRETWVVEALYLDGPTESPAGAAFRLLEDRVLNRDWPDAYGRTRKLDALGVDSGYQPHSVYAWTRKNQRIHPSSGQEIILALKGWDGWGRPPIGTPSLVDINLAGSKVRKGVKVWPVGTWSLKAAFYADVRKEGLAAGKDSDPAGYCHFPDWLDQNYFKQLTAEFLTDEKINGKVRRVWKLKASERDNHLLDCRVYNLAPAEYLGLSSITPAEWAALAKERGGPDVEALPLFAVAPSQAHRPRGGIICRTWPS